MKLQGNRQDEISGFLDQGTSVTGELHFTGTLRIDGQFAGSISTEDRLVIGEHAVVRADIRAGEIEIAGEVVGSVEAKRRAEIHVTARIHGDIHSPVVVVTPGSMVNGRICMASE